MRLVIRLFWFVICASVLAVLALISLRLCSLIELRLRLCLSPLLVPAGFGASLILWFTLLDIVNSVAHFARRRDAAAKDAARFTRRVRRARRRKR